MERGGAGWMRRGLWGGGAGCRDGVGEVGGAGLARGKVVVRGGWWRVREERLRRVGGAWRVREERVVEGEGGG